MPLMWLPFIIVILLVLLLSSKKRLRWVYIMLRNLPRDIRCSIVFWKINKNSIRCLEENATLYDQFSSLARRHPHKVAIYFEDQIWTYAKVEEFCNKITAYFATQDFKPGDTIALILDNSPEYPCIFLGLSRLGIVTALINTNLRKKSLLHSTTVVNAKAVIFGTTYCKAIEEIMDSLENIKLYQLRDDTSEENSFSKSIDLVKELCKFNDKPDENVLPKVSSEDPVIYIYTSGTTGLPKASVMTHVRYLIIVHGMKIAFSGHENDVVYSPLPLYHAGGGVGGIGQAIICGCTTVIRKKFSATNYFKDCARYNVTIAQYIGEMCRYIVTAYNQKAPEKHLVRTMFGNGLNSTIWNKFKKFGVKNILELYGSTEGVAMLLNLNNTVGSIGYIPWFLQLLNYNVLVKCDEAGEPIKSTKGLCIKCNVNEAGIILGKIDPKNAIFNYRGYTDAKATKKKILHDVLVKGDMYFNSGDVLFYDEYGYFYFVDRMGDTFRWKGENVSTVEVESVISSLVDLNPVIVYGVQIPNTEGRAGMAAIVDPDKTINIQALGADIHSHLPNYSIPMFIRILDEPPLTGTFKLKKTELREEGYNTYVVKDKMYFYESKLKNYVSFNNLLYDQIVNSKLRL